jgi:hypothetical protein
MAPGGPELLAPDSSAVCSLVTAQGQWAIPYDNPSLIVYISGSRSEKCEAARGRAEGSHHRYHGVRSKTTDTTVSS